jgi:cardiolipin synthase
MFPDFFATFKCEHARGMDDLRERAERLLRNGVRLADLAVEFQESIAATSEVLIAGQAFYPRMLEDIEAATSSIHVNQFGFRPGVIGERFAGALLAKAREGVHVRLVVDRQGSDPDRASRQFYERLVAGGIEVRVVRATQVRARKGALGEGGPTRWNFAQLGHVDHRKLVVVDGAVGWVGGAGIEDHFDDGRFHDLFVRVTGPVVSQLQVVFVATFAWLGGTVDIGRLDALFPVHSDPGSGEPAVVLHNAPGRSRPITGAIAELIDESTETLDVVNPYVTDRAMIRRIERAARRGVSVRLFVPADANNWACAAAQRFHHRALLEAGVRILEYPTMLHAKAFVRDGEVVLAGTCNLEAWSLRRFFEIDLRIRSQRLARELDERFSTPAEALSTPGRALDGVRERLRGAAFAAISPLL